MINDLVRMSDVLKELGITHPTLYKHMKKLGITPTKKGGNRSFILREELDRLKASLGSTLNTTRNLHERVSSTVSSGPASSENEVLDFYRKRLEIMEAKADSLVKEVGELKLEVGRWQGQAEAYRQQYLRLAENQEEQIKEREHIVYEIKTSPAPAEPSSYEKTTETQGVGLFSIFRKLFK